jgi:predicted GH43/DUF377 family glycosyl hydrolase
MDQTSEGAEGPESGDRFPVRRSGTYLRPDNSRILLRPFLPGGEQRARRIIQRVLETPAPLIEGTLERVMESFRHEQADLEAVFKKRYDQLVHLLPTGTTPSEHHALLIGAYFTSEYSLQSAALFNPSIVPHPDQAGVPEGALRFVMSLRATGEGHLSSIEFREGLIGADGEIELNPVSTSVTSPEIRHPRYRKTDFLATLRELGVDDDFVAVAFGGLASTFEREELEAVLSHPERFPAASGEHERQSLSDAIRWAAHADYIVEFPRSLGLSERVLFPASPGEQGGIEDARFVRFHEDDGRQRYYATYTAFDRNRILPHLIETEDFTEFRLGPLHGKAARDKGMALFPRRIGGRYAMLGRQGGINVTLMFSNDLYHWEDHEILLEPEAPWEYIQMGNCGSPLETEAGWLVLTHGVGALRNYCIGAALLDLDDPRRIIGRLRQPLLEPLDHERDGYVPNVVYSCGSLIHNGWLVVPYAVSDYATTHALAQLEPLLERLVRC